MSKLLLIAATVLTFSYSPVQAALQSAPAFDGTPTVTADPVTCANLQDSLAIYRKTQEKLNDQVDTFLGQIGQVMDSWYNQLSAYEGRTVQIQHGAFSSIQQSARVVDQSRTTFAQSRRTIETYWQEIMAVLPTCLK